MLKKICLMVLLSVFSAGLAYSVEISGVNIPDSIEANSKNLVLNGAGLRTKLFIKLYVSGLYLERKDSDGDKIVNNDALMAIKLHIVSSLITSSRMEETIREGFETSTGGNVAPVRRELEDFLKIFQEEINQNDVFDLIYIPGKGVEVYKNGVYTSVIAGMNFKKALFGIWIGKNPVQNSLKKHMLGL